MLSVFIMGILGGLDSLQVASAVGLMGLKPDRRWMMVVSLMFFDVMMTLAGLLIGNQLNTVFANIAQWLGPAFIMALGLYILIRELMEKEKQDFINNKWLLLLLPFLMSFDNLFAGLGLGTAGYPVLSTTIILGFCSGIMGLLGLIIGGKIRSLIPGKIEMISGIYFIGLAIFLIVKE